jgi:hypothetical protein
MIVAGTAATRDNGAKGAPPRPATDGIGDGDRDGVLTLARLKQLTSVVAPTTLVTSLLFYFGYIGTRSRFVYFGVYLDMTDLSNQQLLLHGLEVIYIPAALGFLAILVTITCHAGVMWLLEVRGSGTATLIIGPGAILVGILLIGRALVGIFVAHVFHSEQPGTTGLAMALGPAAMAYGAWICARRARGAGPDRAERTGLIAGRPDLCGRAGGRRALFGRPRIRVEFRHLPCLRRRREAPGPARGRARHPRTADRPIGPTGPGAQIDAAVRRPGRVPLPLSRAAAAAVVRGQAVPGARALDQAGPHPGGALQRQRTNPADSEAGRGARLTGC